MNDTKFRIPRQRLIEQLKTKGIKDTNVLSAILKVPRHDFVPEYLNHLAYEDSALSIGFGQTISMPSVVAYMSEALEAKPGMTVLEVGTGSGYQAAVLYEMGLFVYTVERLKELYFPTKEHFARLGMKKVRTKLTDGTLGWPEMAPFDRIIVAAGGPTIPQSLIDQLADDGIMLIPVGKEKRSQELIRVRKENGKVLTKRLSKVSFVDLVGKEGWKNT